MQLLPPILQKFIVSWSSKRTRSNDQLPWYLETQDPWHGTPDYVVCTSPLAIPGCLTASTETNLSGKVNQWYNACDFIINMLISICRLSKHTFPLL